MKMQISNYPNYYVTENGDIFHNERKLKPFRLGSYKGVSLCKNGIVYKHYVHRLVAMMFLNNGLDFNLTVNHINGNKEDNRVFNLEIISQRENNIHALKNGLRKMPLQKGECNGNSKLTKNDVLYIKEHYKSHSKDFSGRKLAELFNVTPTVISDIVNGKLWKN